MIPSSLKRTIFLILTVYCLGCSLAKQNPVRLLGELPKDLQGKEIVIFVPGYKGSTLKDKETNEIVWLTFEEILFGNNSLELDDSDSLEAAELFADLSIIPWLYSIDIYKKCISQIRNSNKDLIVAVFPYDWRKSNISSAELLLKLINDVHIKKAKSISIISHSMGGLSVAYMIGYYKNLPPLKNLIFLTVPFRGTATAFIDMHREIEPIFLNDKLLSRKAFTSFESAYELIPHPQDKMFSDKNELNLNTIYDWQNWEKNNWGEYKYDENNLYSSKLKTNLSKSAEMFRILDESTPKCPTNKIINFTGHGLKAQDQIKSNFNSLLDNNVSPEQISTFTAGDGLISEKSSTLPLSLKKCPHEENSIENLVHDRACNDSKVIEILLKQINNSF